MGTAVLFPQDCLPLSKSRHRSNLSDVFNQSPIASKSTLQFFDSCFLYPDQARHSFAPYHGVGRLYPDQARSNFAACSPYPLQREVERRKPKCKRLGEPREVYSAARPASNDPVFTLLQRPKDNEAANELMGRFLTKSDTSRSSIQVLESKSDIRAHGTKPNKSVQNVFLDRRTKNGISGKKHSFVSEIGRPEFEGCNLGGPKNQDFGLSMSVDQAIAKERKGDRCKPQKVILGAVKARRSCDNRYDDGMPLKDLIQVPALRISTEYQSVQDMIACENFSPKLTYGNQPSRFNAVGGGPTRLRRASTESQIVEHLGRYRSHELESPCGEGKSFTRTTSMSLPERWAGPAYSASPAPSSLPLPKFSFLGHKTSSLDLSQLSVEGHKSNITKSPELGSVSAVRGSLHVEGALDVAFATQSLRRMLKLDLS